jgi:hypothetical protein
VTDEAGDASHGGMTERYRSIVRRFLGPGYHGFADALPPLPFVLLPAASEPQGFLSPSKQGQPSGVDETRGGMARGLTAL